MDIEIYGATWCKACNDAKHYCKTKDLPYTYYDIDYPNNRDAVEKRLGRELVYIPIIFINGVFMANGLVDLLNHSIPNVTK